MNRHSFGLCFIQQASTPSNDIQNTTTTFGLGFGPMYHYDGCYFRKGSKGLDCPSAVCVCWACLLGLLRKQASSPQPQYSGVRAERVPLLTELLTLIW